MAVAATVQKFSQLKQGMRARVVAVLQDGEPHVRLQELGLTEGTIFKVIKVAPFGDPIEISLRGYRLCLRKHETAHVEIELVT